MSSYFKYLKYKNKYLQLKMQIGSGINTAKKTFIDTLYFEDPHFDIRQEMKTVIDMPNDEYAAYIALNDGQDFAAAFNKAERRIIKIERGLLIKRHTFELFKTNIINDRIIDNVENTKEALENIFNLIKDKLILYFPDEIDKYIDFIIQVYLNNSFNIVKDNPSSITDNIDVFKQLTIKYNKIVNNIDFIISIDAFKEFTLNKINSFNSLSDLYIYMNSNIINNIISRIDKRDAAQERMKQRALRLEKYKTEPIYKSQNIVIYKPTTENESKYHGQNTKWCTSGDIDNAFDEYYDEGPLYIIEKVDGLKTDKYQLHVESDSFKNSYDNDVDMEMFFNDIIKKNKFDILFLYNIFLENITIISGNSFNIEIGTLFDDFIKLAVKYVEINIENDIETYLKNKLSKMDMSIITSLNIQLNYPKIFDLITHLFSNNLRSLRIYTEILYPFDRLLSNCINLEKLTLHINSQLNDVLLKLTKLTYLNLDIGENKLQEDVFKNMTNLTELTIYNYKSSLGRTLRNLTGNGLKELYLHNYNEPLGDSLLDCHNLDVIVLAKYEGPLFESLKNCKILTHITLSPQYILNHYDDFKKLVIHLTEITYISILKDLQELQDPRDEISMSQELTEDINLFIEQLNSSGRKINIDIG